MNLHLHILPVPEDHPEKANMRLRIGVHVIDFGSLRIVTRPESARLTSKAAAVLLELARQAGNTVTRDQFLDRIWKGRFPTPDVLTQAISELRCALADDSKSPCYIETIPKVGYRLVAPVLVLDDLAGGALGDDGELGEAASLAQQGTDLTPARGTRAHFSKFALQGLLATAALGAAFAVVLNHRQPSAERSETSWRATDIRALTYDPRPEWWPHISPDGTRFAFSAVDARSGLARIVVRTVEPSQVVRLTSGTNLNEGLPVWSPDGGRIAFERLGTIGCSMFVASSLGGDERKIGECSDWGVNYYDWTPDGQALITAESRQQGQGLALVRWDLGTGEKTFLPYERSATDQDLEPHYSPDGRSIAFRRGIAPYSNLYVVSAAGGDVHQVTHTAMRIHGYAWSRDGSGLIFASDHEGRFALYMADVASGHVQALGVVPAEYPDAARSTDAVVYEIPRTHARLAEIGLEAHASPRLLAPSTGNDYDAEVSGAGDRVVFVSDRTGELQVWVYDIADGTTLQLTESKGTFVSSPHWDTGGEHVIVLRHDAGVGQLMEIDVASRRQRILSRPGENVLLGIYGVDPDSYLLVVGASASRNQLVLLRHPLSANETRRTLATDIDYVQIDASTRSMYYAPSVGNGLFRADAKGSNAHLLTTKINAIAVNRWRIVDGRIWYVAHNDNPVTLREFDPRTGTDHELATLEIAVPDMNFSLMPDRKSLVVPLLDTREDNVGIFHLTRAAAH